MQKLSYPSNLQSKVLFYNTQYYCQEYVLTISTILLNTWLTSMS